MKDLKCKHYTGEEGYWFKLNRFEGLLLCGKCGKNLIKECMEQDKWEKEAKKLSNELKRWDKNESS